MDAGLVLLPLDVGRGVVVAVDDDLAGASACLAQALLIHQAQLDPNVDGTSIVYLAVLSADVAIVVLTNTSPIDAPETLAAEFADLVQFGHIRHDWRILYAKAASLLAPIGSLVGKPRPIHPAPPQPLNDYVGTYQNKYFGHLQVIEDHDHLKLRLGPKRVEWPLTHWDGNVFTFRPGGESAPPGTISMARFSQGKVVLEYYDNEGLGAFIRRTEKRAY